MLKDCFVYEFHSFLSTYGIQIVCNALFYGATYGADYKVLIRLLLVGYLDLGVDWSVQRC